MSEATRIQMDAQALTTEMSNISQAQGFEEAIKHFTVVAATDPQAARPTFQISMLRGLRAFLADPIEHTCHQWWAETNFDQPAGGAR